MKTYSVKPSEVSRKWYVVDASTTTLGRLSTQVAKLLIGKDKPMYSHHIDVGDYVIVINSDKLKVTGKKLTDKSYFRHSGYPGGLRERKLSELMDNDSTEVIFRSVRGMLPVNKLRDERLNRLKIYKDENHQHKAQKPETLKLDEAK